MASLCPLFVAAALLVPARGERGAAATVHLFDCRGRPRHRRGRGRGGEPLLRRGVRRPFARAGPGPSRPSRSPTPPTGRAGWSSSNEGSPPPRRSSPCWRADEDRRPPPARHRRRRRAVRDVHRERSATPGRADATGRDYAVQGNILTGEPVVVAMEKGFLESKGKPLAERLYLPLTAGDAAGGDVADASRRPCSSSARAAATAASPIVPSTSASTITPTPSVSSGGCSGSPWSTITGIAAGLPSRRKNSPRR